jgi:cytochrome c biogenesis protein CcmG/thiol:disulfide interchange protein DsbE
MEELAYRVDPQAFRQHLVGRGALGSPARSPVGHAAVDLGDGAVEAECAHFADTRRVSAPRTGRRFRAALGALVLSVAGVACTGRADPQPTGSPQSTSLLPNSATSLPEFTPERFEALLDELRGRPVVVNFWGSWCAPCYREAPVLAAAEDTYGDLAQFLGVDISDQRGPARDFIQEFGWTFPSVYDPDNEILASLGLLGAPVTIVYDTSGERVFEWVGEITEEQLTEELTAVLEG